MFTQILDFQVIDTDKISRIGAFVEKDDKTKKNNYNLYINFDFTRLVLSFKDEKSLDAAYNELFSDLSSKKIKQKYDLKNLESWFFDDITFLRDYFNLFNNDFVNLNDNLLDALK